MAKMPMDFEESYVDFTSQVTVNSKVSVDGYKQFLAIGNMCIAQGTWTAKSGQSISGSDAIFTVPVEYRPSRQFILGGTLQSGSEDGYPGFYKIDSSGQIKQDFSQTATRGSYSFVWFTS